MTPPAITEIDSKTPTRTSFSDASHREFSREVIETGNSPYPDSQMPQQPIPEQITPTTPALTPGASAATDESDTDFQSAYSASPRDSYGNFDHDTLEEDQDTTINAKIPEYRYANTPSAVNFPSSVENTGAFTDVANTPLAG